MKVTRLAIRDVLLVEPTVFGDGRGWFMEIYNQREYAAAGIDRTWVQDNASRSQQGVLRGLHYQLGRPQAKLVRCTLGEVFDVAVDVRRGSPTFGRWVAEVLSADNKRAMFIPEGFAHGFLVLSDVADFHYKCSDFYDPGQERGIAWNCPDIGVDWPLGPTAPLLSRKDLVHARLSAARPEDLPSFGAAASKG